ncbi:hypothetical protein AB0F59_05050 [Micromonospora lupini]
MAQVDEQTYRAGSRYVDHPTRDVVTHREATAGRSELIRLHIVTLLRCL